ncbi:MAG: MMPL family transporter [Dehalococcoidia bacterium]
MAAFSTAGIARASARRKWLVIGIWVVALVIGGVLSSGIADVLNNDQRQTNDPESQRAAELLVARGLRQEAPLEEVVIVRSSELTVQDPAFQAEIERVANGVRDLGSDVVVALSLDQPGATAIPSQDLHTAIFQVRLNGVLQDSADVSKPYVERIEQLNEETPGDFEVLTSGFGSLNETFATLAEEDLQAETRVLPIALVVLILVFGAVVAAFVPMLVAAFSIVIALGLSAVIGQIWPLSFFVTNFITTIGLALGIDYSLFIVERFREERAKGLETIDAIAHAGDTATRAVVFSGLTVIIALLGMFLVPQAIFRSLATGAILVAGVAVLASLTLQPALLSAFGDRVNLLSIPGLNRGGHGIEDRGFWAGAAHFVMGNAVVSVVLAAGLLLFLSLFYFNINLGFAGPSTLPEDTMARHAYEVVATEFAAGEAAPVEIVVDGDTSSPEVQGAIQDLMASLEADPDFGTPFIPPENAQNANTTLILAPLTAEFASPEERATVDRLRDSVVPAAFNGVSANVLVGGIPGGNADFFSMVDQFTPWVFVFVLSFSFVLLLLVFRSIVVPIKAIIMNLLSVGAAYGLLVLVFQDGVGADLLGFQTVDTIEAWIPLFLFTILFGLSMDYHVFLLSRIRERYDQTHDNTASVAFGLRTTANIITGAAAIMIAVFSGFAMGQMVMFQQLGFGLAIAVFLDATVVRTILVPATMSLLGDANWYLPSWLRWLPDLRVEGGPAPMAAAAGDGD